MSKLRSTSRKQETTPLSEPSITPDFGRTARMPDEAERRKFRRQTVRVDVRESFANPDNDHRRDDKMGCFSYWHYKITGWSPNNTGGYDGKRQTNAWTEQYARQMQSYERRRSEKKAARYAKLRAREAQRRVEHGLPEAGPVEPKRRGGVSDMLSKKAYSAAPVDKPEIKAMSSESEKGHLELG